MMLILMQWIRSSPLQRSSRTLRTGIRILLTNTTILIPHTGCAATSLMCWALPLQQQKGHNSTHFTQVPAHGRKPPCLHEMNVGYVVLLNELQSASLHRL